MKWPLRPMTGRTREHEGPGRAASKLGHVQCRELRGGGGQEHSLWAVGTFANEPRGQEVAAVDLWLPSSRALCSVLVLDAL